MKLLNLILLTILCIIIAATLTGIICYMFPDIKKEIKTVFGKKKCKTQKRICISSGIYHYNKKGKLVEVGNSIHTIRGVRG